MHTTTLLNDNYLYVCKRGSGYRWTLFLYCSPHCSLCTWARATTTHVIWHVYFTLNLYLPVRTFTTCNSGPLLLAAKITSSGFSHKLNQRLEARKWIRGHTYISHFWSCWMMLRDVGGNTCSLQGCDWLKWEWKSWMKNKGNFKDTKMKRRTKRVEWTAQIAKMATVPRTEASSTAPNKLPTVGILTKIDTGT